MPADGRGDRKADIHWQRPLAPDRPAHAQARFVAVAVFSGNRWAVRLTPGRLQHYVVDGDGLAQAFQRHVTDLFQPYGIFDRVRETAADQDLSILGFAAQPRGEVGDRADRGVVHALGEADLAEGGVALGNADPETDIVAVPPPGVEQYLRRLAHRHLHVDRPFDRIGSRQRIVEEHHDPVAAIMVDRAFEAGNDRPERGVIVAQQCHDLLRLGALGKGSEAAQITEHDDDLAAMAFEYAFIALRDDQFSQLQREEAAQFACAFDLAKLHGDARFQLAVPACNL